MLMSMAELTTSRHHFYGSNTISGQATALLGNKYNGVGDTFQIQEAKFLVCEDALHSHSRQHLIIGALKQNLLQIDQDGGASRGQKRKWSRFQCLNTSDALKRARHCYEVAECAGSTQCHMCGTPALLSANKRPQAILDLNSRAQSTRDRLFHDMDKLVALGIPAAIVSLLIYRHVSCEAVSEMVSQLVRDPVFHLVSGAIGYWLSIMFPRAPAIQSPLNELGGSQDVTVLEDIYGIRRKFSRSYFADSEILEEFFRWHYKGSPAESLVANKQYNLMIEDRTGPPVTLSELCEMGLGQSRVFQPPYTAIMAVLYRASTKRCLDCTNEITSIENVGTW